MQLLVTYSLCAAQKLCGHFCVISFWVFEVAIFRGDSAPKLCTHFSLPTPAGQPGIIAS
jgi:delta 1-pyrroline-5-carboxylate dehydrogenase